ncbi:MAG: DUF4065 domain-containing protein, partial [Eubacterium sp.]|nr:DUF4065 domain-containing protein [Eubacterium sp.]
SVVPSLPGCCADGKSVDELRENTDMLITDWIEAAKESGIKIKPEDGSEDVISSSPSIMDVAGYILDKSDGMTSMQLQKMVYFCQAWALGWTGKPLFKEKFEDWKEGPVSPVLFNEHRGKLTLRRGEITNKHSFTESEKELIDDVISEFSDFSGDELSEITHLEGPWVSTRRGLKDGDSDNRVIDETLMREYYSQLR